MNIRPWQAGDDTPLATLITLLQDTVHGGASIGFLAPLSAPQAAAYWQHLAANLGPQLHCWLAWDGSRVLGSVQLALCDKANGRHRGEIQKLMVHRDARGQGIASRLLHSAEQAARDAGRTLLVLDTEAGSHAEHVYRHLGWQHGGDIPDYAARPDGVLHATRYFYKRLEATGSGARIL